MVMRIVWFESVTCTGRPAILRPSRERTIVRAASSEQVSM